MASFGLALQRLPSAGARVLALGQLAGAFAGDGWFAPRNVEELFEGIRVPSPGNISQELARLRAAGLVRTRKSKPSWSLTPEGNLRVQASIGEIDPAVARAEATRAGGAVIADAFHTVLPPSFAPTKWAAPIASMLERFEFATNVFCMTRFPRDADDTEYLDPVSEVVPVARDALRRHGLFLHLAGLDRKLDDDLFGDIAAHAWACRYGVGLFEDRLGRGLNKNMLIEMGSMLMTGRRCLMLKDVTIGAAGGASLDKETIPTNLVGHIYDAVDFDDVAGVSHSLHHWAAFDLGLGRCEDCPPSPHS
jgi:hypothetical protein